MNSEWIKWEICSPTVPWSTSSYRRLQIRSPNIRSNYFLRTAQVRNSSVPVRFQYGSINTVSQAWSIQFNFRIYVYKEGLARFATTQYSGLSNTNMAQSCMHLTNYSINKYSDHFVRDDEEAGSKRKFSSIKKWFTEWVHVPIEHEIKHKINSYDLYSIGGIIIMMNYGDKLTI